MTSAAGMRLARPTPSLRALRVARAESTQPDDWDTEEDGEWEAPSIPNPKCSAAPGCGPWTRPLMPNPAFKGKWAAPLVDNPEYKARAGQRPSALLSAMRSCHLLGSRLQVFARCAVQPCAADQGSYKWVCGGGGGGAFAAAQPCVSERQSPNPRTGLLLHAVLRGRPINHSMAKDPSCRAATCGRPAKP